MAAVVHRAVGEAETSGISLERRIAFIDVQIRTFQNGPPHLGRDRALAIATLRQRQGQLLAELNGKRGLA